MRGELVVPVTVATVILAAVFVIATKSTIVPYERTAGVFGVNIVELTEHATGLPEQRFDTY